MMARAFKPSTGAHLRLIEREGQVVVAAIDQFGGIHELSGILRCDPSELRAGEMATAEITAMIGYGLPDADDT